MRNAVGVRMETSSLRHVGPIISRVYRRQLGVFQRHIPRFSRQCASGVALGATPAIFANDPNPEAGREARYCRFSEGNLYGTTSSQVLINTNCPSGCGVVFKVDRSGKETVLALQPT